MNQMGPLSYRAEALIPQGFIIRNLEFLNPDMQKLLSPRSRFGVQGDPIVDVIISIFTESQSFGQSLTCQPAHACMQTYIYRQVRNGAGSYINSFIPHKLLAITRLAISVEEWPQRRWEVIMWQARPMARDSALLQQFYKGCLTEAHPR